MATDRTHVSIHMPHYETNAVHFDTPTNGVSADVAEIQNFIRQKAESQLQQCSSFTVSLPTSITGITSAENRIEFNSLFQTPTLNELEMVSTNPDGSSKKLNDEQLKAVKATGEFEVDSIHFVGQRHRWKLNRLLQSGVLSANQTFFKECSCAFYMLIIYARDRILADGFSFSAALRSWRQGIASLLDALIGLPAIQSHGIDEQVENDRSEFLAIELSPHPAERKMHDDFCGQVPLLLEMMEEHQRYRLRRNPPKPPEMLPYPHHFVTPNNIEIDLRLYNPELQTELRRIVSSIVSESTPKNWFNINKRRLINEYKHNRAETNLSKKEIAQQIQTQLNDEYADRVFQAIESSAELENLSAGLGRLLVTQARSVLAIRSIIHKLQNQLEEQINKTREMLKRQHPIKSEISRWLEEKLSEERVKFIRQHQWDPHQLSIEQLKNLGDHQAAYFIQRDMKFRKDSEPILRNNLKPVREPKKTINSRRYIWFPKNWIIERTYPEPVERIPTVFANESSSSIEEEQHQRLARSDTDSTYLVRQYQEYSTTTKYPFWRWKLFFLRTFCWLSNSIYFFCLIVPFISPVSFRALLSPKPFVVGYKFNDKDLKLHKKVESKTQTFLSRLFALWRHIGKSRQKFEQAPDRGLLGKNVQRFFNRLWNYVGKGIIGTASVCLVYPITCVTVSTLSFLLGVLSPIWLPIGTLAFHILQILFYDANSAGEYGRKLFCFINTILMDFGIGGIVQPILVTGALVASPFISALIVIFALLHRCTRGIYDTILYHLIVKRLARVPAHDTFLARRIAGPGLASEYFYQVSSPEVLAALESLIEQKELIVYRGYVENLLMKPIHDYREFFDAAFRPFSAIIQSNDRETLFYRMNEVVNEHLKNLRSTIENRHHMLHVQRGSKHDQIRLTESDLTAVLVEGTKLVENLYTNRIFCYLKNEEIEKLWNDHDVEENDWLGLASKLLQELFCRDFLTPLEHADIFYNLKVDHLTLSKYAHMINSANIHDDLEVVTSVYLPETSFNIHQPTFDTEVLDPNTQIFGVSSGYSHRDKRHGAVYNFIHRKANYLKDAQRTSNFVNYSSITCRFSTPFELPPISYVNIIIYNRDHNSISSTSIKNVPRRKIVELMTYMKIFYGKPLLPFPKSVQKSKSDDFETVIDSTENNIN